MQPLQPLFQKNDAKAKVLIGIFSVVVFLAVVSLHPLHKVLFNDTKFGFDVHIFGFINALVNSLVALCLIIALIAVKQKNWVLHKKTMMFALVLSVVFLVSYILHSLLAGDTAYGGTGTVRTVYYIILSTHIFLAAVILPFILFTAYRGLTGEYLLHKKIAKYTFPLWLYVAITGPIIYYMIKPYYI